jgi:signal transduction histidine kinase
LVGLADRVAAVGGRLNVQSSHLNGTTLRAEVPCE